jgi:glycosyltransferase involved in cell wall biosynthesis
VIFTGAVPHSDVAALLSAADVAVIYPPGISATIVETPLKLFEYMASGKAIVAPCVPNMRRVLEDRVTALLVPPDTPAALAGALRELFGDSQLRLSLGERARRQAIHRHSWNRAVGEVEGVLRRAIAGQ